MPRCGSSACCLQDSKRADEIHGDQRVSKRHEARKYGEKNRFRSHGQKHHLTSDQIHLQPKSSPSVLARPCNLWKARHRNRRSISRKRGAGRPKGDKRGDEKGRTRSRDSGEPGAEGNGYLTLAFWGHLRPTPPLSHFKIAGRSARHGDRRARLAVSAMLHDADMCACTADTLVTRSSLFFAFGAMRTAKCRVPACSTDAQPNEGAVK